MKARWLLAVLVLAVSACGGTATRPGEDKAKAASINVELGIAYMRHGNKQAAMEKLQKALQEDPTLVKGHTAIAVLYEQLQEFEMAEQHFRRALQLAPKDSSANNNYGGFLCRRGHYAEAVKHFDLAAANPLYDQPELALTNAGLCLLREEKLDQAERYFREALKKNPFYPQALLNMARVSLQQQQYLSARAYLQRFQEVARHTPESLAVGIEAETALGDRDAVASYRLLLKNNFPTSPQAERLIGQPADGN